MKHISFRVAEEFKDRVDQKILTWKASIQSVGESLFNAWLASDSTQELGAAFAKELKHRDPNARIPGLDFTVHMLEPGATEPDSDVQDLKRKIFVSFSRQQMLASGVPLDATTTRSAFFIIQMKPGASRSEAVPKAFLDSNILAAVTKALPPAKKLGDAVNEALRDWLQGESKINAEGTHRGTHLEGFTVSANSETMAGKQTQEEHWVDVFRGLLESGNEVVREAIIANVYAFAQLVEATNAGYPVSPRTLEAILDRELAPATEVVAEVARAAESAQRDARKHTGRAGRGGKRGAG